jgi:phosphotransferase system enzyme I (PtsP)
VPLIRDGRVRGVLVIQNRTSRDYSEEEVETLQTIAMVVAELVAGGGFGGAGEVGASTSEATMPARLSGLALNGGLAMGLAVVHRPRLTVRQIVAEDPTVEAERFRTALSAMHSSLDTLMAVTADRGLGEGEDILQTYRMFAEDRGWIRRILEAIDSGLSAEAAVQRVRDDMAARLGNVSDRYLRDRVQDFDDLANRLLVSLSGRQSVADSGTLPEDVVLVARSIGPAELLDYDHKRLRAVVLEEGSATSHVAIVARALDIPVVGRCAQAMKQIETFDTVLVDGDNGQVFARPAEDALDLFQDALARRAQRQASYGAMADLPAVSLDGHRVAVQMNAGLLIDMPHMAEVGADGVGLFRTEIPFMVRETYPTRQVQQDLYARVLDQAGERPVIFRTLDIGGDKRLPYLNTGQEENPALGWRALRIGLDRPALLMTQMRALIGAASGRALSIMFPMVTELAELQAAKRLLRRELARAEAAGQVAPARIAVGAMVEVPALLWQLDEVLAEVDLLAIGSNDLLQYAFAADRGDPRIAQRYDTLTPTFLRLVADVVGRADAAGVPVSVCGEMAGRPVEALALLGLGVRRLSVAPGRVGPIKALVRSADIGRIGRLLETRLRPGAPTLRPLLSSYAHDHGIVI